MHLFVKETGFENIKNKVNIIFYITNIMLQVLPKYVKIVNIYWCLWRINKMLYTFTIKTTKKYSALPK